MKIDGGFGRAGLLQVLAQAQGKFKEAGFAMLKYEARAPVASVFSSW